MSTSTTTAKRISKGQIEGQFLQFDHNNSTSSFLRIAEIGLLLFLIFLTLCTFIWYGLRYIERESRLQSLRPPVAITNGSLPGATAAPRLDDLNYQRAQFIRNMTLDAWRTYKAYAWEADALQPVTRSPFNGHGKYSLGRTLVLAMSTLHLMGFEAEFALARRWIRLNVNFANVDAKLPVGEIVQEYLASMLACFALTGDRMFLKKAEEIALMLTPAYSTPTGISYSWINPAVRVAEGRLVTLSASLGQLLEYNYLSRLTENAALVNRTARYRNAIKRYFTRYGLYMTRLNVLEDDDSIRPSTISCFTSASRYFYISLVKSALQLYQTDPTLITMFNQALDSAAKERLFAVSPRSNLRYLHLQKQCPESAPLWYKDHFDPTPEDRLLASWSSPYNRNHSAKYADSMKTSTCYFGGLLFLAADALKGVKSREGKQRREGYCKLGVELTETCHQASLRSGSGLAPAKFYFDGEDEATNGRYRDIIYETGSFLGPELAESYLILWRATRNPKYREAAWELVQAIQSAAHVPTGGYSQLADVNELRPHHTNYQPPHFLGATLKYLYLIFADEGVLRSKDWIFNVAGQPLPVLKL